MQKFSIKEQFFTKKNIYRFILSSILIIILIVSLFFFFWKNNTVRRMFIFPSVSGELIIEYRNLDKNPVQGEVQYFIDEVLLGSQLERTKKIFTFGTKALSCFQRDDQLYLDLSSDLLQMGDYVVDIKEGFDILRLNITKNFSDIKTINFFVDGKYAY